MKNRLKLLTGWFMPVMLLLVCQIGIAQKAIKIGEGTYAEYPPLHESEKPYYQGTDSWGDATQKFIASKRYVVDETSSRAMPSTDWFTTLVTRQYSGNLWSYPSIIRAQPYGLDVSFPKEWSADGRTFTADSKIKISADGFYPESALANDWDAWRVDFVMNDATDKTKNMFITMAHGIPFTWIETSKIEPIISAETGTLNCFNDAGAAITFPFVGDHFGFELNGEHYGVFAPNNTTFENINGQIKAKLGAKSYLVIATMPAANSLATFHQYAYAIPRKSSVTWNYNEETALIDIKWSLQNVNLKGEANLNQIQGWLPHNYRTTKRDFAFNGIEYRTPRGIMKCATGKDFTITYKFTGILPNYPNPEDVATATNPYRKTVMDTMLINYTGKTGYGNDTYWGGKDLLNYARYMQLAKQTGNMDEYKVFKSRITEAITDWYTYYPGKDAHYFSWYTNWGSFLGQNTRDNGLPGIDYLQDHHFCYAYHAYSAALLFMDDPELKAKYGEFSKMIVKDYANWDPNDTRFPFFRSMDPWAGHCYAGGMGDENGNGMESSSESLFAWGGMFLLGTTLDDKPMRDAAIFGYVQEAQAVAEYWFDRQHIPENGGVGNYDYTKYDKPYNSNLVTNGIGWWTYFSGDPFWMHSIQWLPMTPALNYLYEDLKFAKWDFETMWKSMDQAKLGWKRFEDNSIGNVPLSYYQISNPQDAAKIFDDNWDARKGMTRSPENNAFTYWYIHSHLSLGEIQWDKHTNFPTSTVYLHPTTNVMSVAVYNPSATDKECRVYDANNVLLGKFMAPAQKIIQHKFDATLTSIKISQTTKTIQSGSSTLFTAVGYDQYGAQVAITPTWSVSGGGSIAADGRFTANANGSFTVTATAGGKSQTANIRVGATPVLTTITVQPSITKADIGKNYQFSAVGLDQYNDTIAANLVWSINKGGSISQTGLFVPETPSQGAALTVKNGNVSKTVTFDVRYPLMNIALGKTASSSSSQGNGMEAWRVVDGDRWSRWGSHWTDPQWWMVDLGKEYSIENINLNWETAMAADFTVELSSNGTIWNSVYTVTGNTKAYHDFKLNGVGRYIRVSGTTRATEYGYSLFELEAYGTPYSANGAAVLSSIVVEPSSVFIKDTVKQQFIAIGYDQYGNQLPVTPTWEVIGKGLIDDNGLYTPTMGGLYQQPTFKVKATAEQMSGFASVVVEEVIKPMQIVLSPTSTRENRYKLPLGVSLQIEAQMFNMFGVSYQDKLVWSKNGVGTLTSGGEYSATALGDAMIIAKGASGNATDTLFVTVLPVSSINLAYGKPTFFSSYENDQTKGAQAVDNDITTKWGTIHGVDNQFITIDLLNIYDLDSINVAWENAYASKYSVQISNDNVNWTTIGEELAGNGGKDHFATSASGRYVKIDCTQRYTNYGYGIYEVQVYGNQIYQGTPVLTSIQITPDPANVQSGATRQFTAKGLDQFGFDIPASVQWSATSGTITSEGLFTASANGTFSVTATSGSVQKTIPLVVGGAPKLTSIVVTPAIASGFVYQDIQFSAATLDQFGNPFASTVTWSVNNGASISAEGMFNATSTGSYTVTATNGALSANYTIQIDPVFVGNLAFQKPVTASTNQDQASRAVNGVLNQGWESAAADPQWIYVDLQGNYSVNRVVLTWENASGKDYKIQISDDANIWADMATVTGNTGNGTRTYTVTGTGQYVRMYGTARSTGYAYHLYELEVYGYPAGITPVATSIEITPSPAATPAATNLQFSANVLDQMGGMMTNNVAWSVSGGGSISATGLFTPSASSGSFTVTATASGKTQNTLVTIGGAPAITYVIINEQDTQVPVTDPIQFTITGLDQFRNPISGTPTWSVTGGGTISATGLLTTTQIGTFEVKSVINGITSTANFTVTPKNIALGKPVSVSTGEAIKGAAVDGDQGSRWTSSNVGDNQWIYVDLQAIYDIDKVLLNWEGAAGKVYDIQVSYDAENWNTLAGTTNGLAGKNSFNVTAKARYVRVNCTKPLTVYGYSLFEFEVYGVPSTVNPVLNKLLVSPNPIMVKVGTPLQLKALCYDQFETLYPTTATWTITGGGSIDANSGLLTGTTLGSYYVTTKFGNMTNSYPFTVVAPARLTSIVISQPSKNCMLGDEVQLTANGFDQYGDPYTLNGSWFTDKGTISQTGLITTKALGTATIKYIDGSVVGVATLNANMAVENNIALLKKVYFSSELIDAINVNDGNNGTRWESEHTDPQSITIDLQEIYDVYKVVLRWETGSSKHFKIQMSNDTLTWTDLYEELNNPQGPDVITTAYISGKGRYLRMLGLSRNTGYGHSLFEIEAYGVTSATPRTITAISVNPKSVNVPASTNYTFEATGYDQFGLVMPITPNWATNGSATINGSGVFNAGVPATNYQVSATVGSVSEAVEVIVGGAPRIAQIKILPETIIAGIGFPVQFTATATDQFGNNYPLNASWNLTGGGTISNTGLFTPVTPGNYTIQVTDGNSIASAQVKVQQKNIALFKPAFSSDWPGQAAANAVDFDYTTRWESKHGYDDEWFYVDLQTNYTLYKVVINWETAGGKAYKIQVSNDATNWTTIFTENNGNGKVDEINLAGTGRYVRMQGVARLTPWGYSFYEFEVYGYPAGTALQLARIDITPKTADLGMDATKQFVANGYDQFGNPFAITPTWGLAGQGTLSATGLYTATQLGEAQVNVTAGGKTATAYLSVDTQPILATLQIAPQNSSVEVENTKQFTAVGLDQWGNPYAIKPLWSASNGGTFDANGLFTAKYKGDHNAGTYTVSVAAEELVSTTNITITEQLEVSSIVVTPGYKKVANGLKTQLLAATADQYNNPIVAPITWSCSAGSISAAGLFTPSGVGSYTITATSGNVTGISVIEVVNTPVAVAIDLTPATPAIELGKELQLTASVFDQNNAPFATEIFWKANGGLIDQCGLFKGTSAGKYTITAYTATLSKTVTVTVSTPTTVVIDQDLTEVATGAQATFTALVYDQFGTVITTPLIWSATGGTITQDGKFTASVAGNYTITASAQNATSTAQIKVTGSVSIDKTAANGIEFYPNPVIDILTINCSNNQFHTCLIFDLSGKLVAQQSVDFTQTSIQLDFTPYTKGVYLIKLIGNTTTEQIKVAK